MKIELSVTQIRAVLKALYTEKAEIVQRKKLNDSIEQGNDAEYMENQNLRVVFESAIRGK